MSPFEKGSDLRANSFAMSSRPEDAMTAGTRAELILRCCDVRRNAAFYGLSRHWYQVTVALAAPAKEISLDVQAKGSCNLSHLLPEMIAVDPEMRNVQVPQKSALPCEDNTPLRPGCAQQSASTQMRAVRSVVAEQAQPGREAPEHHVGGEARSIHLSRTTIAITAVDGQA